MNKRGLAELQMAIGENMRVRRKALHITQEQLAERAGLSVNYIARLEVGMRAPSLEALVSLADALSLQVSDIVSLEHERSAPSAVDQIAACLAGLGPVESEFLVGQMREAAHFFASAKSRKTC